jgi:ribonuclease HI
MKSISACLYTDGACSGNPGPGGWGYVLVNFEKKKIFEGGGGEKDTTNNRMEMKAIIVGLIEAASQKFQNILVMTDSTYVIRGFTQWKFGWKKRGWLTSEGQPVSNQDLWKELDQVGQNLKIDWLYVRGHQGTPGNERVDQIAVAYSKMDHIHLYENCDFSDYIFDVTDLPAGEPLPEMKTHSAGPKKPVFYVSYVNGVLMKHQDWNSCERTVKGQPKALYKKLSSEEELKEILKKWGVSGN